MADASQNHFDVNGDAKEANSLPANVRALSVEGEFSRTEDGKGGGPFLVVLRLYQEKSGAVPRRVLAQWAGVADNYRYLTGNLDNRADIDREGLLGEMGKRIAEAASDAPRNAAFDAFVATVAQSKSVLVTLVPTRTMPSGNGSAAGQTDAIVAPVLEAGREYRIKIASQESGTVVVVGRDANARLIPLYLPGDKDAPRSVELGKPILVPALSEKPWIAPVTDAPTEQALFVFVRHEKPNTKSAPAGNARVLSATSNDTPPVLPSPVRVLSTGTLADENLGHVLEALLKQFARDPKDTWTAQRFVVKVVPTATKQ